MQTVSMGTLQAKPTWKSSERSGFGHREGFMVQVQLKKNVAMGIVEFQAQADGCIAGPHGQAGLTNGNSSRLCQQQAELS